MVVWPIGFDLASREGLNNQQNENRQNHSHRGPETLKLISQDCPVAFL
jgi:hypothetical protein